MFTATSWRSIASSPSTGIILKNARTKGCNRIIGRIFKKRSQEAQGRQRRGQKGAARCRGRRGAQGREESGEDTGGVWDNQCCITCSTSMPVSHNVT